jgi:cellulose synthase (UDP-forming)
MPQRSDRLFLAPILTGRTRLVYLCLIGLWACAAVFFWQWWLRPVHFVGWAPFLFVTIPLIWIYALQLFFVYVLLHASRSNAPDPVPGQWRVAMIVTKTPSEPFAVVEATLLAMLAQDYPHDTWLADEDPGADTIQWCATYGVQISTRKGRDDYHRPTWPRRTRCKEGNLAFFYDHWGYADYDIVSQLDADHVPQRGYLREMLRPFADPGVGYVSAPSICGMNADESWAARTRLHTEAAFHGVFQTGYTAAFAPMCIGSHYAVRTSALKDIGGLGPELAEDHATSMMMNAGGWRGVHAIDAIAFGDGPASVADMVTQEFQWSRSLTTLLLQYTPRYLPQLPSRLRFLFLFCQLLYACFAITAVMMYLAPLLALGLDIRFADVAYPSFLGHAAPSALMMTAIAFRMRADGFFRPFQAPVIGWEKMLFLALQWPWVLWGCLMAIRDRVTGRFVDFRITPKGQVTGRYLPGKILGLYTLLALGCSVPVLLADDLMDARGFLLLSLLNGLLYTSLLVVIVTQHLRENGIDVRGGLRDLIVQLGAACGVVVLLMAGFAWRGTESLHALAFGLEPLQLVRAEYSASGAGQGDTLTVHFRFDPRWN